MFGFVSVSAFAPSKKNLVNVSARRVPRIVMQAKTKPDLETEDEFVSSPASEMIDKVQAKFTEYTAKLEDLDLDELQTSATSSTKTLASNFLAGEWLQRGESYGFIQILAAVLILRPQGGLDGLSSLLFGPLILLTGALVCGKGAFDLGLLNMSIWPKPTPNGYLKTDGLYGMVRHPIYCGVLMSSFGYASVTASPARFALTIALSYFFIRKIETEENFLREAYGEEYSEYEESVPYKLLPKVF